MTRRIDPGPGCVPHRSLRDRLPALLSRVLVAGLLAASAAGVHAQAADAPESLVLMGRGSAGSTSDLAFVVMEEAIKRAFPGKSVQVRRLPGTATAVPPRVNSGEAQIGHGVGESIVDAWNGERTSARRPKMRDVRYLGSYLGFLAKPSASPTMVVKASSPIKSWDDLKDKRLGVGTPDSLTSTMVNVALKGVGLSYDQIKRNGGLVHTGDWNQQMDMLADGQLDAVFVTGDHPSPIVGQFAATNAARIVGMNEAVAKALMDNYPTFTRNVMPAGTYPWQKEEAVGVQLSLGYVVHKDVPEAAVYQICKALYSPQGASVWGDVVPSWKGAEKLTHLAAQTVFIPLHPGARKCFQELNIPVKTIGAGADTP
jgi:TRAP transporter TAXI family solute receptor